MDVRKQVKFPEKLYDRIEEASDATDRTFDGVVVRALKFGIDEYLADEEVDLNAYRAAREAERLAKLGDDEFDPNEAA